MAVAQYCIPKQEKVVIGHFFLFYVVYHERGGRLLWLNAFITYQHLDSYVNSTIYL